MTFIIRYKASEQNNSMKCCNKIFCRLPTEDEAQHFDEYIVRPHFLRKETPIIN